MDELFLVLLFFGLPLTLLVLATVGLVRGKGGKLRAGDRSKNRAAR